MANTTPIRPTMRAMAPGDSLTFPIERLKAVKSTACELGVIFKRTYSTHILRDERLIEVTRVD